MNSRKRLISGAVISCCLGVLVVFGYKFTPSPEPATMPVAGEQSAQSGNDAPSIAEIQARAMAAANKQNPAEPATAQQQARTRIASTGISATGGIVESRPQGPLLIVFNQIRAQWQPVQFRMVGDSNWINLVLQTDNMFTPELALRDAYRNMLSTLPAMLQSAGCSQCQLQVVAHTDNRLDSSVSLLRSQQMAEAVARVLAKNGWPPDRMSRQGLGDTQPQSPNNHVLTRSINRRILLRITSS